MSRRERIKEIVFHASRLPVELRIAYAQSAAGGDRALAEEACLLIDYIDTRSEPDSQVIPPLVEETELPTGVLLAERYRIHESLGRGAAAVVYRAHDEILDLPVAIKRAMPGDDRQQERLRQEAALTNRILHPGIRRIYHLTCRDDGWFLVMEYLTGPDLGDRLRDDKRLPVEEVAGLAVRIASSLAAAHEVGIIHGDIKPENLILDDCGLVRTTDFGQASYSDEGGDSPKGGTPRYLSPERQAGAPTSKSDDVYALALVLRDLVLGRPAMPDDDDRDDRSMPVSALFPDIDPRLDAAIQRGLLPAAQRPADASEYLQLLRDTRDATASPSPTAVRRVVTEIRSRLGRDDEDSKPISALLAWRRACTEIVLEHGGLTIDELNAQEFRACFGVSAARDADPVEAVRAAIRIAARPTPGGFPPATVAVDSYVAEATLDASGSPFMTQQTNSFAEMLDRPEPVVVSAETRAMLAGRFDLRALPPIEPGTSPVYEAGSEIRLYSIQAAQRPGRATEVGRDAEKLRILRCWDDARDRGRGSAVLLSAEPGMGKTRLVGEVGLALRNEARWIEVGCPDRGATVFEPWLEVLDQITGVRRPLWDLTEWLLGSDVRTMPSALRHARFMDMLVDRIVEVSKQAPLVLVFEDLQWCDLASIEAITILMERVSELPLLLIATYRNEFQAPQSWSTSPVVERIGLAPLRDEESGALLADLLGELDPDDSSVLVERGGGVPLFLEQLAAAVRSGCSVNALPTSLYTALLERIERLRMHGEVARTASVIGVTFDEALLADVSDEDPAQLATALAGLTANGLIEPLPSAGAGAHRFTHSLLQEAAYESQPSDRRRAFHERCVRALRADDPRIVSEQPEILARHLAASGQENEAASCWIQGGQTAAEHGAIQSAITCYRKSLVLNRDPARELEIRLELLAVEQASLAFSSPEIANNADKLLTLLPDDPNDILIARTIVALGRRQLLISSKEGLAKLKNRVEPTVQLMVDPRARLTWRTQCGTREWFAGMFPAAEAHFLDALAQLPKVERSTLARQSGLDIAVYAAAGLAVIAALRCNPDAIRLGQRAIAMARETQAAGEEVAALSELALMHLIRREPTAALAYLAQAQASVETNRLQGLYVALITMFQGCARAQAGESAPAFREIRAGLEQLETLGVKAFQTFGLTHLAEAEARESNFDAARKTVERAVRATQTIHERMWQAELLRLRAELLADQGAPVQEVAAAYREAIDVAAAQGAALLELRCRTSLAAWHPDANAREAARAALRSLVQRPELDPDSSGLAAASALLSG